MLEKNPNKLIKYCDDASSLYALSYNKCVEEVNNLYLLVRHNNNFFLRNLYDNDYYKNMLTLTHTENVIIGKMNMSILMINILSAIQILFL